MHCGLKRIPVSGPWITAREIALVTEAVTHGWYGEANRYIERFEEAFAQHTGRRYAIALPSCTSAIHLALAAAGVGHGDEVIVPEATWIATAAPVRYVDARAVFADIEADHWCIDPASVERLITPRTRAIIGVDLYGNMADWRALREVASRRGVLLVEDAAQSIGATLDGKPAGYFGDVAVFSFHGSKTLTTGEGGMLVTDDEGLYQRAMILRDHGRVPGDSLFVNSEVAYKYKMSSLQAALGLAQLERLPELVAKKREIFGWYRELLGTLPGLQMNQPRTGSESAYWMSTVVWEDGPRKTEIQARLTAEGVDTRPFFHPLSSLPAYRDEPDAKNAAVRNPVAYRLHERGLNLPSALMMAHTEAERASQAFLGCLLMTAA